MDKLSKMDWYDPEETYNFNQRTTLVYTFQYQDAFAQLQTTMGGDAVGGEAMTIDFDCGITAPVEEETNKKHCIFDDINLPYQPYREVTALEFHYPNGETVALNIEDCTRYLIGIQIIKYDPHLKGE